MKKQMLKPTEAAVILGVSSSIVCKLCSEKFIKAEKIGSIWRIFKTDFYKQFKLPASYKPIEGARFINVTEAAEALNISVRKIQEMCGVEFPAYKVGRTWVIPIKTFKKKYRLA